LDRVSKSRLPSLDPAKASHDGAFTFKKWVGKEGSKEFGDTVARFWHQHQEKTLIGSYLDVCGLMSPHVVSKFGIPFYPVVQKMVFIQMSQYLHSSKLTVRPCQLSGLDD